MYVQPNPEAKNRFWRDLADWGSNLRMPWTMAGDFNDFASLEERSGCVDHLMDTTCTGSKFTWVRRQHGRITLQERLDRVLFNLEALNYATVIF